MNKLFNELSPQTRSQLDRLMSSIDAAFPLPGKYASALPSNIVRLSRLLTSERNERNAHYLSDPALLAAYLRYFLPWNVWRLCKVLTSAETRSVLERVKGDTPITVIDMGAGPLTLALALWTAFPAWRDEAVALTCVDNSAASLRAGRAVFDAFTANAKTWRVKTIHADIRSPTTHLERSRLVVAFNVFNELFGATGAGNVEALTVLATRTARFLASHVEAGGAVLVAEPGVPRAGQFISLLRAAFLEAGFEALLPCPMRAGTCAAPGGRRGAKWCHFGFNTEDSPTTLRRLSERAGLEKDRATISFILAAPKARGAEAPHGEPLRVLSDAFALRGGMMARYCCGAGGLTMLSGDEAAMATTSAGSLITNPRFTGEIDNKSGARIAHIQHDIRR
jgi:ribosomal protein RSM22 (predicted rRNA methylase)